MMIVLVILIKRMKTHLLRSAANRSGYLRASSMYSADWCVYMFVLEVGLAEKALLFVAHSDSLHNFIIP